MTRQLEQLAELGIEPMDVPGQERHTFFVRGEFAALVERTREGTFGRVGTAGLMSERGLAMLVWREGKPFFVVRHYEAEATPESVVALRAFTADLERILLGGQTLQ
ncbi:MAG: hypothetical protein IT162_16025 [Bryobacterales bacterium]|nr:hypothetical protein [Bryobacterales bacterium]